MKKNCGGFYEDAAGAENVKEERLIFSSNAEIDRDRQTPNSQQNHQKNVASLKLACCQPSPASVAR